MLTLSKKADYALIALAYLAERPGRVSSAREIAGACGLPLPLLMNLLKLLHQHGFLGSTRGSRGGYQLRAVDLDSFSLLDLLSVIECAGQAGECGCLEHVTRLRPLRLGGSEPLHAPARALHYRLQRFLDEVKLSDLVLPGRRIDVPLESLSAVKAVSSGRPSKTNPPPDGEPTAPIVLEMLDR